MRVSVVVPVWNPGPSFQRCIDSLLAQTLPREQYEIVLVDDGSTDGTAHRLDRLADEHPGLVRVLHIPASGWPGRPRNVGIDASRGEFVHLVDNDDTLPPYALERMTGAAGEYDADVIMGRPASDFRGLVHSIYRQPVWTGTLREFPELATTLTPHKMFRRSMLDEHAIRFPEGKVPLEDQMFGMSAYLHARRITVLADRVYYYYLRRVGSGRNAGDTPIDALRQSQAVEHVLDVVERALDETGADDALRNRVLRRFYRINLLPRLVDAGVMTHGPRERDEVVDEVRRVTATRFGPAVTEAVGCAHRTLGRLLATEDTQALLALGEEYREISLRLRASELQWRDGALHFDLDGGVTWRGELLRCDPTASGWALPAALAPGVPVADRELDPERDEADVELSLIHRATSASFAADSDLELRVHHGVLRVAGHIRIDPQSILFGHPLDDGLWELRGRMRFAGWNRTCTVEIPDAPNAVLPVLLSSDGRAVAAFLQSGGELTLDVGQWLHSLPQLAAPNARLTVAGTDTLVLTLDAVTLIDPGPGVELLLEPKWLGRNALVALGAELCPGTGGAQARFALSAALPAGGLPAGVWHPWLRLRDSVAAPEKLPWTVRVSRGRTTVAATTT